MGVVVYVEDGDGVVWRAGEDVVLTCAHNGVSLYCGVSTNG